MPQGLVTVGETGRRVLIVLEERPFYMQEVRLHNNKTTIEAGFLDLIGQGGGVPYKDSHHVDVPSELANAGRTISANSERWLLEGALIAKKTELPEQPLTEKEEDVSIDDELLDMLRLLLTDRKDLH